MNSLAETITQPVGQLLSPAAILTAMAFAILPLAVFAPLAVAPLVLLAGGGMVVAQGPRAVWRGLPLRLAAGFLAFVLFGAVSALWAVEPRVSLYKSGQLLFIFIAGLLLYGGARSLTGRERERVGLALVVGASLAIVLLLVERYLGMPLSWLARSWSGDEAPLFWLNRGSVLLAILSFPVAWLTYRRWGGVAAVAMIGGSFVVVLSLKSNAAVAALVFGLVVALVAYRVPRATARGLTVGVVVLSLMGPVLASALVQSAPVKNSVSQLQPSAYHRLMIWSFVAELIDEKPVLGWGLDASRSVPRGHDLAKQPDDKWAQGELLPLHPHNAALQIRLELGILGLVLALPLVLVPVLRAHREFSDNGALAATLGSATAIAVVAFVSFGIWQSWWLCAIWAVIGICIATMGIVKTESTINSVP